MPSLRKLFQQEFPDHEGRPGLVGGSKKRDSSTGKTKPVKASKGTPLYLQEDPSYESSVLLPNGKPAKRYKVLDGYKKPIGTLTETTGYKDKSSGGRNYVTSRKEIVNYIAETPNERFPTWERSYHSSSRQAAIDWIEARK